MFNRKILLIISITALNVAVCFTTSTSLSASASANANANANANAKPEQQTNIIVISDLNGSYGSTSYGRAVKTAVRRIQQLTPDMVIITGDMVAGQGRIRRSKKHYQQMWSAFHETVTIPLTNSYIPVVVTPGNHDGSKYPKYKLERVVFNEQWKKYKPQIDFVDESHYPEHYSFSHNGTFFISLDATTSSKLDSAQIRWVKEQLRKSAKYKHKVLFGHLPQYAFTKGRERGILNDSELQNIMKRHKVDVFLSGHHHGYYPGEVDGIRMVSQAALGSGLRYLIGSSRRSHKAMTSISFSETGIQIEAYRGRNLDILISRESLPTHIGPMIRDDLP
ncbi:MAG: metallophosphoesterase [Bacteriovoracaceae bacterium]|nr:metallophosphoesterase [Bacteriovoracaceae bacterium]